MECRGCPPGGALDSGWAQGGAEGLGSASSRGSPARRGAGVYRSGGTSGCPPSPAHRTCGRARCLPPPPARPWHPLGADRTHPDPRRRALPAGLTRAGHPLAGRATGPAPWPRPAPPPGGPSAPWRPGKTPAPTFCPGGNPRLRPRTGRRPCARDERGPRGQPICIMAVRPAPFPVRSGHATSHDAPSQPAPIQSMAPPDGCLRCRRAVRAHGVGPRRGHGVGDWSIRVGDRGCALTRLAPQMSPGSPSVPRVPGAWPRAEPPAPVRDRRLPLPWRPGP